MEEMNMKFVMTQAVCPEGLQMLDGVADVYVADNQDPNNYLDEMKDADALIVRIAKCDGHAIENSPNLKVIGRTGVGYDSVDVKTATAHGIPVVITPGANNRSVAEHAVAMMFALSKNLVEAQQEMCKGNWEIRGAKKAFELEGKTIGILGLGAIGRETAKICEGCGMKVAAYDPFLSKEQVEGYGAVYYENYEDLLKVSDVVSIHVPLTDETKNMISKKQLTEMKKTALIINCSRGGIINETDLVEALKAGEIAGAGTDVFCSEPPKTDDPLLNCPNLIVSPHSAAQTREAVIKMAQMCVKGCLAVAEGKKWPFVADKSVYDHEKWKDAEWAEV
jgi:D-3-phosphoglycerate dehydrogenase